MADLDPKKLLGFRLVAAEGAGTSVISSKPGFKANVKAGAKIGSKAGAKIGSKLGAKIGAKNGIKA